MLLSISEILAKYAELKTKVEKIEWLKKNDSYPLRTVLQGAFDPNVVWDLPDGDPPYTPTPYLDQESMLYNESRKLYLYVVGGHPGLSKARKYNLFIQLLEAVTPSDAIMLLHMKDKKLPYAGLNIRAVNEAFPGLLPIIESSKEEKRKVEVVEPTVDPVLEEPTVVTPVVEPTVDPVLEEPTVVTPVVELKVDRRKKVVKTTTE